MSEKTSDLGPSVEQRQNFLDPFTKIDQSLGQPSGSRPTIKDFLFLERISELRSVRELDPFHLASLKRTLMLYWDLILLTVLFPGLHLFLIRALSSYRRKLKRFLSSIGKCINLLLRTASAGSHLTSQPYNLKSKRQVL